MKPTISFPERILLYLAASLSLIGGYAAKTISKKVRSYAHIELGYLGILPKFPTLADFLKGEKYLFQRPHRGRSVLSFEALQAFNGAMDFQYNILQNALVGADVFATVACARSSEYLYKRSLDHGRSTAQFLCLEKLSDPAGRILNLSSHDKIVDRLILWYNTKPEFLRVRLDTHKTDYFHKGCFVPVTWGTV